MQIARTLTYCSLILISLTGCQTAQRRTDSAAVAAHARLNSRGIATQTAPIAISFDSTNVSTIIPRDFIGLSYETSQVQQAIPLSQNSGLTKLLHVLGPDGVVRFGGNTSDYFSEQQGPVYSGQSGPFTPTPSRVADAASFVKSLGPGWSLIWGLNWQQNNFADSSVNQVQAILSVLNSNQVVFQIGNEPDLFPNLSLDFVTYQTQWQSIHDRVVAAIPSARFGGPDSDLTDRNFVPLAASVLGSQLVLLTQHHYGVVDANPSSQDIVDARSESKTSSIITEMSTMTNPAKIPIRMTETGSIGAGPGNSKTSIGIGNTLGSALWNLKEMINLAQDGWVGVNYHGSDRGLGYSPTLLNSDGQTYTAQSTLYAMVLFNDLKGGAIIPIVSTGLPDFVAAIAVMGADGKRRLLVTNMQTSQPMVFSPSDLGLQWSNAAVLTLTGPDFAGTTVTIGGSSIGSDGSFNPQATSQPFLAGGVNPITIPASSAVLVTFDP